MKIVKIDEETLELTTEIKQYKKKEDLELEKVRFEEQISSVQEEIDKINVLLLYFEEE